VLKNTNGSLRDLTYCDAAGNWELSSIPAGKYELLLDANNDFPATQFEIVEGDVTQLVDLSANETLEVNLTVNPL
jgi:hypothetical protein